MVLNSDGSKLYITVEFAVPGVVVYAVEAETVKKIDTVIAGNYLGVHPRTDKLYFRTPNDRVVVVDTKTARILRVIRFHEGSRPNGVDFGGPNDEVWVNGDGSATVIDSTTDEMIEVIRPRVAGAGRVAVSPDGRFAATTQGSEVFVIDTRTKEIGFLFVCFRKKLLPCALRGFAEREELCGELQSWTRSAMRSFAGKYFGKW